MERDGVSEFPTLFCSEPKGRSLGWDSGVVRGIEDRLSIRHLAQQGTVAEDAECFRREAEGERGL